ncbi:MAG: hypothetical protein ABSA12_09860 [Verrucomicrobiia bacterium]
MEKLFKELEHARTLDINQKADFLLDLEKQDDWSFVIKAHALLEAAISQMIFDSLGETRLQGFVQHLPLIGRTSKLAVAEQLGLLSDEQRGFIRRFSELRNSLVHNFDKLDFSFQKYCAALDESEYKNWLKSIAWASKEWKLNDALWEYTTEKFPKVAVRLAVYVVLVDCSTQSTKARGKRKLQELSDKSLRESAKRATGN